jgi:thiol-disulfide isomerase/thioredoxin
MRKTGTSRSKNVIVAIVIVVLASTAGIAAYSYSKSASASSSSPSTALSLSGNAIGVATNGGGAQQQQLPPSQSTSKAADFNLKTTGGKQVSLESFKGKPLVLWFMAAWCPSCAGQAGAIKQVSSEYGNKINVLVIDLWAAQNIGQSSQGLNAETGNDIQAFIAKNGSPQWNAALDTDRVTIKYGITQVDSTIVVDGNGNIVFMNLGPSGYQPLKDALTKVVL